jgi:exodeoxyribonuclease V alpha subunit
MIDHNNKAAFEDFVKGYLDFLMEEDIGEAVKKFNQQRVLATVKHGENGLYALNKLIEKILHQERPDLINPANGFYHNRPVIMMPSIIRITSWRDSLSIL